MGLILWTKVCGANSKQNNFTISKFLQFLNEHCNRISGKCWDWVIDSGMMACDARSIYGALYRVVDSRAVIYMYYIIYMYRRFGKRDLWDIIKEPKGYIISVIQSIFFTLSKEYSLINCHWLLKKALCILQCCQYPSILYPRNARLRAFKLCFNIIKI